MRGPKLVAELERKLGVHLGSLVSVPLNNADGTPRQCQAGKARACVRKNCPKGYVRYLYGFPFSEGPECPPFCQPKMVGKCSPVGKEALD